MNAERGMRNSEWMTVRLGDVVEIDRNGVDPARLEPSTSYVGLEHIDSNGSIRSKASVASAELRSSKFRFDSRHVLFGKLRPYLRKIARPTGNGVCSTDILPLLPSESVDRNFLFHWLRTDSVVRKATAACSGANLPRLSPEKLRDFEFRVPRSLSAQQRIAAILDKADAIRRKRQESLRLIDRFLRSVFLDMFGDPVTNPKGWAQVEFGEMVASTKLGMIRASREFGWHMPVPYVRMDALTNDGAFRADKVQRTEATPTEIENYRLEPDDFLFNTRNSKELVGKVTVYPGPAGATFNNNLMRIRFKKFADPYFVNQQFQFARVQRKLEARKQGTTSVFAIYWKNLQTLPVLCPPATLQGDFRAMVDKVVTAKTSMTNAGAQSEDLFASLQQRVFQGEL